MSHTTARALWLYPPNACAIESEKLAPLGANELCVRTLYSAVSRGTETLVYRGMVPTSEYTRMRAPFQQGTLPGPVKHGYANVGVVEAGPEAWLGRQVFCLFPHQTRYVIATDAVLAIPDAVPAPRAILAANMETALNAVWDSGAGPGDLITVVGAGVVGSLVAALCARLPGVEVELLDTNSGKMFLGNALGVDFRAPSQASVNRDLVIHASASEAGLNTALELAGFEATVLEMSWYGDNRVNVALGAAFHSRRLTLCSSQVGAVSPARRARWSPRRRLQTALWLLADTRLDVLINAENDFEEMPAVMERLALCNDATLCQRIRYS